MALFDKTKYVDADGFQITELEGERGERGLWRVVGDGEAFKVPEGVKRIYKQFLHCPNLLKIYIPESVQIVESEAFCNYDAKLDIFCAAKEKPKGFIEGQQIEAFTEDYEQYEKVSYESWLCRSVSLSCSDSHGEYKWGTDESGKEIDLSQRENLPRVHWGACL